MIPATRTSVMRSLTRMRASHAPSRLQIPTPSAISISRSYSSLRPLTLTLPHHLSTPTTRPTLAPHPRLRQHQSHAKQQSRPFSLLPLLEASLTTAQTFLTTLHTTTATPWYLTIPLFALTLSVLTRIPTTLAARRIAIRRARLQPFNTAFAARVHAEIAREKKAEEEKRGSKTVWKKDAYMRVFARLNYQGQKERERRWGVQWWKSFVPSLAVFPVWVVGIEALRRMCGGPRGLLGSMIFGSGEGELEGAGGAGAAASGAQGQAQGGLEAGVEMVTRTGTGMAEGVDTAALAASGQADVQQVAAKYLADPSMAVEGCLWFPDLTAADPLHILPFALSAILVANTLPMTRAGLRVLLGLDNSPTMSKIQLGVHRTLLIAAMAIGPLTMDLPAALHLYWFSSAILTSIQTAIIKRLKPLPNTTPPAKRVEVFVMPTREEANKP